MSPFSKRLSAVLAGVLIVIVSFTAGDVYGVRHRKATDATQSLLNKETRKPDSVDFAPFWEAWNTLDEKFVETHGTSTTQITDQDKVYGAIKGLTDAYGDPYTTFFPPQEAKEFQSEISGNFDGIGLEVGMRDGVITVISPLKDTPAYKAGIKAGDKILKIDTTITSSLSIDQAVHLMRGERGTEVTLTILSEHDEHPREIKVVRQQINIPTIETTQRSDGIFVIRLYSFSANAATLFRNALQEFVRSKQTKLILDLRGNPGGYLEGAVDMASWFLPSDKVVVTEDTHGHGENTVYKSKGYNIFNNNLQMIILVDGGSASASEILSGALQQHGIAKLVGTKTYGKGSVQELVNLTPSTSLKITVARWLTPNGTSISGNGLTPDVEVKVSDEDIKNVNDVQMQKAVELLGGNAKVK
jgi:carboxyl-terminal processing protease